MENPEYHIRKDDRGSDFSLNDFDVSKADDLGRRLYEFNQTMYKWIDLSSRRIVLVQ